MILSDERIVLVVCELLCAREDSTKCWREGSFVGRGVLLRETDDELLKTSLEDFGVSSGFVED